MGKDKKLEIELNHIIYDYKAILQYLKTCMENKLDYASYMGIMPYFCMYVLEGYKFLAEKDIINRDCIKKSDIKHIEKCRAGGVKLYSEFNQKSFNSINNFNRDEYLKFFKKTFPNSKPQILSFIDNYFICCIDNQPIGNYHLYSKKFISMEIGSYIYDIKQKVYDFARVLSSFISQILVGIDKRLMNCNIEMRKNQLL